VRVITVHGKISKEAREKAAEGMVAALSREEEKT